MLSNACNTLGKSYTCEITTRAECFISYTRNVCIKSKQTYSVFICIGEKICPKSFCTLIADRKFVAINSRIINLIIFDSHLHHITGTAAIFN